MKENCEVKNMKEKRNKKYSKKMLVSTLAIAFLVSGFFGASYVNYIVEDEYIIDDSGDSYKKSWKPLNVVMGADTTDGTDSIVNIYIIPLTEIASNITSSPYETNEGIAWEHGDDVDGFDDGEELAGELPYSTTHVIAIEVNFSNKAYNSSSADWEVGLVRAYITSADLGLTAELMEEGTDFSQQTGSTSAHLTFYVDNSDAGWPCGQGEVFDVTDVDFEYYG